MYLILSCAAIRKNVSSTKVKGKGRKGSCIIRISYVRVLHAVRLSVAVYVSETAIYSGKTQIRTSFILKLGSVEYFLFRKLGAHTIITEVMCHRVAKNYSPVLHSVLHRVTKKRPRVCDFGTAQDFKINGHRLPKNPDIDM